MKGLSAQRHRAAMPTQSPGTVLVQFEGVARLLRHIIPPPPACYASRSHRKYGFSSGFLTNIIPRRGVDGMLFLRHNTMFGT